MDYQARLMRLGASPLWAECFAGQLALTSYSAKQLVRVGQSPAEAEELVRQMSVTPPNPPKLAALGMNPRLAEEIALQWKHRMGLTDFDLRQGPLSPLITFFHAGTSTYIDDRGVLRTAGVDEPVFEGGGLRLRPAETNLVASVSQWVLRQSSRTSSNVPVPTGTPATFYKLVEDSATNQHYTASQSLGFTAGKKYSASLIVKAGERTFGHLSFPGEAFSTGRRAAFDLINGVVTEAPSGAVGKVVRLAGDVFEISMSATATNTATGGYGVVFGLMPSGSLASLNYQGDGASGAYIWGGQVNEGDPIPYIPTTDSAVTRAADSASIRGDAFASVWNPMEGAVVLDFERVATTPSIYIYSSQFRFLGSPAKYPSDQQVFMIWFGTNPDSPIEVADNTYPLVPVALAGTSQPRNRLAICWTGASVDVFANGIKVQTGLNSNLRDAILFRGDLNGQGVRFSQNIFFTTRPSDAQMEALTS